MKHSSYHWYNELGEPFHDEDLRTARKNGRYGSVTTVLGAWGKPAALQKWIDKKNCNLSMELLQKGEPQENCAERAIEIAYEELDKTAAWGTAVHDRAEKYNIDKTVIEDDYLRYWTSWIDWSDKYVKEVIHPERTFVDHDDKLAGTIDLVFEHVSLGICVGDYKNREFKSYKGAPFKCGWYDKDQEQTAYYSHMVKNELGMDKLPPTFNFGFDSKVPRNMDVKQWPDKYQQASIDYVKYTNKAWRIKKRLEL